MKKNKLTARLIQLFSIVAFLGMAVLTIQKTGLISRIGVEDIYWERARFLLGQGGATLYDGSSICSIGYSLFLVPICALLKSPYAAYKAAILLNGILLCGSYVMAVLTAKKLFSNEKESFLSAACFFAVFCPVFAASLIYTGPEMLVQFLLWCAIYFLNRLWNVGGKRDRILFAASLILMLFFQIEMLGVALALLVLLYVCVRRRKVSELSFLKCALAVMIGVIASDVAEKAVLYLFSSNLDVTINSSLGLFLDRLKTGWENGYVLELIRDLLGKGYILILSSFLLICPVLGRFLKKYFLAWRTGKKEEFSLPDGIVITFFAQLVMITVYDNARYVSTGAFSLTGLTGMLSPLLLLGVVEVRRCKNWAAEMTGSLLAFCITAFAAANILQINNVTNVAGLNCGIFKLFQDRTSDAVSAVYMATCLMLLVAILLLLCFRWSTKKSMVNRCLRCIGTTGAFVLLFGLNILMLRHTAAKACTNELRDTAPFATILSELSDVDSCVYFNGSGNDEGIIVIQSLLPETEIYQVKNTTQEQVGAFEEKVTENTLILTGSKETARSKTVKEGLENFQILYLTQNYALWAKKGSPVFAELEERLADRVEVLERTKVENVSEDELLEEEGIGLLDETEATSNISLESELVQTTEMASETETGSEVSKNETGAKKRKKVTYGKKLYLAPGTYRMEIYFTGTAGADENGTITVSDKENTIVTRKFDEQMIAEDGHGAVVVTFSDREAMKNVTVQIEGTILSSVSVDHIYYRKLTSAYTMGYAAEGRVKSTTDVIRNADKVCGTKGTVTFVDDMADRAEDISLSCFQTYLDGYEVKATTKADLSQIASEYLIGVTSTHSYYGAMDRYAVVLRNQSYTVLVKKDSVQYAYFQKSGRILSDDTKLFIQTFTGSGNVTDPISLEMGSYAYECELHWKGVIPTGKSEETAGVVYVRTEDEVLAQLPITYGELQEGASIVIPFYLRTKTNGIYSIVELADGSTVTVNPTAITLASEKYQYGQEEEKFADLLAKIRQIAAQGTGEDPIPLTAVQTTKVVSNRQIEFSQLQEQLPECSVDNMDFDQANAATEDMLLLTYGLSKSQFGLLGKYSVLAHSGKYTLWARNDGQLLQQAMQSGISVLNSGKKLSLESIAAMSGDTEAEVVNLPKAIYNVTVELEAEDLETDDTVEVTLLRDKTDEEITSEVKDLIDAGYTKQEAIRAVDRQAVCGTGTYNAYEFDGAKKIVSIRTNVDKAIENLCVEAFSWHGENIEGAIIWIEIA